MTATKGTAQGAKLIAARMAKQHVTVDDVKEQLNN